MENSSDKYKYSILKYRHSSFAGESLNVAYVVFFERENKIYFTPTNNLNRISNLYPDFSFSLIRNYIKDISSIMENINSKLTLFDFNINGNINSFLNKNVLPLDGSSLYFSEEVNCFRNDLDINTILNYLSKSFIFNKKTHSKSKGIKDIFYDRVKGYIKEEGLHSKPNFFKNFKVENEIGTEFKFDFAWTNGCLNLIKELDLNLANANTISRKSYENFGLLYDLKSTAEDKDYKFDFLVSEPRKRDLFKEYEHSIKLISNLPYANVIEKGEFDKYISKVKNNIL